MQVGLRQIRVAQVCPIQIYIVHRGAAQRGTDEIGARQISGQ